MKILNELEKEHEIKKEQISLNVIEKSAKINHVFGLVSIIWLFLNFIITRDLYIYMGNSFIFLSFYLLMDFFILIKKITIKQKIKLLILNCNKKEV